MKISFYVKLFFTFIFFASSLLIFSFFSFGSFYKEKTFKKSSNEINKVFSHQEHNLSKYIKSKHNTLKLIASSKVFKSSFERKNSKDLFEFLEIIIKNNEKIQNISFIDLKGQELFKYKTDDLEVKKVKESNLENISNEAFFKNIRKLKNNQTWNTSFLLQKEFGEIKYPLTSVLKVVQRLNNGFLVITLEAQKIIDDMQNSFRKFSYVIDEYGNFIIHKNSSFSWSKYTSPNKNINEYFVNESKKILNKNFYVSSNLISKRLYLNDTRYITAIIEFDKKAWKNFNEDLESYFISTLTVGMLLSIFLALLFSEPISKLNAKVLQKNEVLNQSVEKSSLQLHESLQIIDKYVLKINLDVNGIILDVSDAFCDLSGYLKGELIGHDHKKLVFPNFSKKKYYKVWQKLLKGKSTSFEIKGMKKDGSYFWVETFIEPVFDKNRQIVAYTIIENNITDKKLIQDLYDDINIQVSQYNAIFENAHSGIALVDLSGNFKKVNTMLNEYLGYEMQEFLKLNAFDIVLDSSKSILNKIFIQAKQIGDIRNIEKIFIHKDNSLVHLEVSLSLLPDKEHFVLVLNSLEDKRRLQELNQNLSEKINQEVEKSRQKDKIHQEEQIKNAKLSSIGSLAAGITHEINTPLTYIKGNFEMMGYDIEDLEESDIKTRMLEDRIKINDGLNRIANIVESMREMSQTSKEAKEQINIYSTLITALTMAYNRSKQISKIYLNEKEFTIDSINKNEFEFLARVQKQRVEQVWIIIINNALDELVKIENYEKRDLQISVKENEEFITISFKDNAGGINENIISTIFDPFVSSKEHSGMGVGLNIAKKIIDQQDGEILAYNWQEGAVFEIKLRK